jgi:hypothetical protein
LSKTTNGIPGAQVMPLIERIEPYRWPQQNQIAVWITFRLAILAHHRSAAHQLSIIVDQRDHRQSIIDRDCRPRLARHQFDECVLRGVGEEITKIIAVGFDLIVHTLDIGAQASRVFAGDPVRMLSQQPDDGLHSPIQPFEPCNRVEELRGSIGFRDALGDQVEQIDGHAATRPFAFAQQSRGRLFGSLALLRLGAPFLPLDVEHIEQRVDIGELPVGTTDRKP